MLRRKSHAGEIIAFPLGVVAGILSDIDYLYFKITFKHIIKYYPTDS
jgi:hypothetical protein